VVGRAARKVQTVKHSRLQYWRRSGLGVVDVEVSTGRHIDLGPREVEGPASARVWLYRHPSERGWT